MRTPAKKNMSYLIAAVERLEQAVDRLTKERDRGAWPKSPAQVADLIGKHRRTVIRWILSGQLRAKKTGKTTLVTDDAWKAFLESRPKMKRLDLK